MTKQQKELPPWRIDNIIPLISISIALVINVGALFWWGGRLSLGQDQVIANQKLQYDMWLKLESRVGTLELSLAKDEQFDQELKRILNLH